MEFYSEALIVNVIPFWKFKSSDSECNTSLEVHSEAVIPNVMPFWNYIQKQRFWREYHVGITLGSSDSEWICITVRSNDSECNTILVLHSEAVILNVKLCWYYISSDSECNTSLVLHSEAVILNVIPVWYYIQKQWFWM